MLENRIDKSFYRKIFALILPIAMQNLINVGISSIDVLMLGKVGEDVLSAASLASQISFIMNLFLFGTMSGASVLLAQYWGKQDMGAIKTVFGIAMKISFGIGVVFAVVTFAIPQYIMMIFSNDSVVIEYGVIYLRIVCFSYLFIPVSTTYLNVLRSMEKVTIAMVVYLSSMLVNIIVNAFLIFGLAGFPKLGIAGAAIGTVVARIVEIIIIYVYDKKINNVLSFKFNYLFRKDRELFKDFLNYSLPVMANELLWGAGVSSISAVLGHMGSPVVAANSVVQVVRQLAMVISFGVASAAAIMIGKAIGEGKKDIAGQYGRSFLVLSIITGILGSIVVLIARPVAIANLELTTQAQGYLNFMMYIMSYFVIGQSINTTIVVGILRSGGDTRFGLYLDTIFMWGVAIGGGILSAFVFKLGVYVTYIILLSDEVIKIPVTLWRYKSKKWLKDVTR